MDLKISNLQNTSNQTIVNCLLEAFKGYFVEMPKDVSYWENRFTNARVDKQLSYGVFDKNNLVGFILNGIDIHEGKKCAYNSGTGIIVKYRGNRLVDKIYDYSIPLLKENGIEKCLLEVIDQNDRAIKVYERIGFSIKRRLKCFSGQIDQKSKVNIVQTQIEKLSNFYNDHHYSWDNKLATVKKAGDHYKVFSVVHNNEVVGYFVIDLNSGYIAQLESKNDHWGILFNGISQVSNKIRINNIDENRHGLVNFLHNTNVVNTIDQYEMSMFI